jgi:hypothetical protein
MIDDDRSFFSHLPCVAFAIGIAAAAAGQKIRACGCHCLVHGERKDLL